MNEGLDLSDYFIVLFVAIVLCVGAYTVIKFMRSKD